VQKEKAGRGERDRRKEGRAEATSLHNSRVENKKAALIAQDGLFDF
jgi:hypothetical protein